MIKKLVLMLAACGLCACESMTAPKEVSQPKFPTMNGKVKKFKEGIQIDEKFKPEVGTLTGNTWDMKKGVYELTGGKCDNSEKGEKVVIWRDNLTIKNGQFSHWEDGVNLRAKNVTFENVVFQNCEDALNMAEGCESFTVKNCYFGPHPKKKSTEIFKADKLIQAAVTKGNNRIEGSTFWNGMNAIRIGLKKYDGPKYEGTTTIKGNKFVYISTAVQETRGKTKISDNEYISVGEEFKVSED